LSDSALNRTVLTIVPLGGLGEIGRNMLALCCGEDILVIDAGLMFPEQEMLGIDLVIPDVSWLRERLQRVRGIVLTHGHEDHIGGLPYVLPQLQVPVYGTGLTLGLLRNKLRDHHLVDSTELHEVVPGESRTLGCFDVEWVHTTHSIPDACALAIRTPLGMVIHSGDFKVDTTPVHGEPPDLARLARLGDEGVLLLLSDSTNAEHEGTTPSERSVGETLDTLFNEARGRIVMATFASNISRLQQAIDASQASGRKCFIVGRSMLKNVRVAEELGFLRAPSTLFVSPKEHEAVPDQELAILCTGAQGEPLSALTRMAAGEHPMVNLHDDDTVIISANPIPGNEEAVHRTINNLYRRGARVFNASRHRVHASGHASREELKLLLTLTRPRYFIPVHGEYRHLALHAELARSVGVDNDRVLAIDNGTVVEIDAEGMRRSDNRATAGYVYVDGLTIEEADDVVFRDRQQLAKDGLIIVVLTVERATGSLASLPELVSRGFIDDDSGRLFDDAREHVREVGERLAPDADWTVWQASVHEELARFLYRRTRRRPLILPLVTEI
jgi:ribonuclease J